MKLDGAGIANACDHVARHCTKIADTHHGSAWLFDKLMRYFSNEPAAVSVTIPVYLNAPVMSDGEATIYKNGHCELRRVSE